MILANITTPLIGLVDTAVLGHLSGTHFLAGASIGALILTQLYWICGFLRMSTTGLSAQAKGQDDPVLGNKVLYQSMALGGVLGLMIIVLQSPILEAGILLSEAAGNMQSALREYFLVRVYGAPAALINLALIGWLIGQQYARQVMIIQIVGNLLNAFLDIGFVVGFGWEVKGVALASVITEYTILCSSLWVIHRHNPLALPNLDWLTLSAVRPMFSLNTHMFVRNLFLQLCLAFLTFQGARYGQMTAATNAIIMQFFVLIALGLDAVAYAVEALVGEAHGAKQRSKVAMTTLRGLFWSGVLAVLYGLMFYLFGEQIIAVLTDQVALQEAVKGYMPVVLLLPLIGHWCFLFDGVYIGLTLGRIMRNTMVISACAVFFPVWYLTSDLGNLSLWIAFLAFLAARSITLGLHFWSIYRSDDGGKPDETISG